MKVWDVAAGRERLALHGHSANIWGVEFSPDGATLASTGNDMTLRFWDPRDGRPRLAATIDPAGPAWRSPSPPTGGTRRRCHLVQVVELEGFDARRALAGHDNSVYGLAFRPGRAELASAAGDRPPSSGPDRGIASEVPPGRRGPSLAARLCPRRHLVGPRPGRRRGGRIRRRPGSPRVVDAETGRERSRLAGPVATTTALAIDRLGRRIASGFEDGTAISWDVATGGVLRRFALGRPVRSVALLPAVGDDAPTLFAAAEGGRRRWWTSPGARPAWRRSSAIPRPSPSPRVGTDSRPARPTARSASSGSRTSPRSRRPPRPTPDRRSLAFHPDGRLLASAG